MFRVFKVMVILVALPLLMAVSVQPADAVTSENPVYQSGTEIPDPHPVDAETTGGPVGSGEGDPDEVGGGYGAAAGEGDLDGLFGGLFGFSDDMTFEEFIYLMMLKFMPTP